MYKLASRLGCLAIGFVLCLTLTFIYTRITRSERQSMSESSPAPSFRSEATLIEVRIAKGG